MANLEEICRHYEAAGLYTHVYASCGFLSSERPIAKYSRLPGKRSVFDLASLTKALVTTPLVLWLCRDMGQQPEKASLSAVFGPKANSIFGHVIAELSVRKVLRHETGLPSWRNFYVECEGEKQALEDVLRRADSSIIEGAPERYSDVGFILLGRLLEEQSGKKLIDLWWDRCNEFGLGVSRQFGPGDIFSSEEVISTGYCPVRRRQLIGEVHDENCWALGGFAGHAGLFGAGESLERLLASMWSVAAGKHVFSANFLEGNSPGDSLMGWRKGKDDSSNSFAEGRACGHLGFTGTAFWVDPKTESYGILLTNRVISGRISPAVKDFRREAFGAMWEAIRS